MSVGEKPIFHVSDEVQFYKDVRNLDEVEVAKYLESHRLDFLQPGSVIKIRKSDLWSRLTGWHWESDRSNKIERSLVVLSNGTAFHDDDTLGLSSPGSAESIYLGKGQSKTVWKINNTNCSVAVSKAAIPPLDPTANRLYKNTAEKEYKLSQMPNSPHILKVQTYGIRKGISYTVTEECSGTLQQHLDQKEKSLTSLDGKTILKQAREALDACHAANVTHNDMHVENILIDMNGNVKLADFEHAAWTYGMLLNTNNDETDFETLEGRFTEIN